MPYPSCLSCSSQGSSHSDAHEETQKHDDLYGLGGLQPPNGVAIPATASTTDLYTRLVVLTKDYQEAQKENTQKQAVIEYLLTSKILESKVEKEVVELRKEISSLKHKLVEHTKDDKQLRIDLHKALHTIFALDARTTVTTASQPKTALGKDYSKANNTTAFSIQDLIDFSDHNGGSAHAEPASGGTTLLNDEDNGEDNDEDDDDYMSGLARDVEPSAHTQSATTSFSENFDFEDSPYIHHFVNGDGATNSESNVSLLQKHAAHSAGNDKGSSRLATLISPDKSALPARSSIKVLEVPKHVASTAPRWSRSTFFEMDAELSSALFINQRNVGANDLRHPDFFKYGLRFTPSNNQRNIYRTVTISGIPVNITMRMILDNVRGGAILEFKLLNTLKVTGSNTALIIFLHEHSALAYEEHAKRHPVMFDGSVAKVTVVPTPTWPIKPKLYQAVFNHQHSRCLEVHSFPRSISPSRLRKDIGHCEELDLDHLIHMEMRKDGTLLLQFSSIDAAGWAYGMLSSFRAYRNCEPCFTPDPCSQPLETLLSLTKIDRNVAKELEQKSQDSAYDCPSSITNVSSSVSSDGATSSELI